MLLFGSQSIGWTLQRISLLRQQAEKEEIAVVNHRERVRPPEVELEIAIYILSILWELLSCRPQVKAILNHSTSHWGVGGSTAAFCFLTLGSLGAAGLP